MIKKSVQERVDALFSSFTEAGSPGCALGIMKGGDLVYKQGYGLANLEHSVTITPSTTFYIASMAKQFTGMAIALLAEQGKIDLDADIRTYLPYVPEFGHAITTRHLLHHTSGHPGCRVTADSSQSGSVKHDKPIPVRPQEFLKRLFFSPPRQPGRLHGKVQGAFNVTGAVFPFLPGIDR